VGRQMIGQKSKNGNRALGEKKAQVLDPFFGLLWGSGDDDYLSFEPLKKAKSQVCHRRHGKTGTSIMPN